MTEWKVFISIMSPLEESDHDGIEQSEYTQRETRWREGTEGKGERIGVDFGHCLRGSLTARVTQVKVRFTCTSAIQPCSLPTYTFYMNGCV